MGLLPWLGDWPSLPWMGARKPPDWSMRARFFSICMDRLDGSVDMAKAMVLPSTSLALKPTMLMDAPFIQTSW